MVSAYYSSFINSINKGDFTISNHRDGARMHIQGKEFSIPRIVAFLGSTKGKGEGKALSNFSKKNKNYKPFSTSP